MSRPPRPDEVLPFVSLIMPVRNEGKFITECLDAVMGQDYPPDRLEVFIVDGMSTDSTPGIAPAACSTRRAHPAHVMPWILRTVVC